MDKIDLKRYSTENDVQIFQSGTQLLELIEEAISKAEHLIHFQVYIFKDDECGQRIIKALIGAASRGIKVYLLLDSLGSNTLSAKFIEEVIASGIIFQWFNPFSWRRIFQYAYRLHQKVITIDYQTAILGGFNISNDYLGPEKEKRWLDFGVIVKGSVVPLVVDICRKTFESNSTEKIDATNLSLPEGQNFSLAGHMKVKVSYNNFLRGRFGITKGYKLAIKSATKSITLINSYFLPSKRFLRLLIKARKRGVKVRLILPKNTDVPIFRWAGHYLYHYLLKNQIEIYEWKPSVLHAKVAIVDDHWTTVGSYNLNHTSILENSELNIEVLDRQFAKQANGLLDEAIREESAHILWDEFREKLGWMDKIRSYFSYKVITTTALVLRLFGAINRKTFFKYW